MDAEEARLGEAERRLKDVIRAVVKRRVAPGKALSWRLLFEIEDEAISEALQDPDLELRHINMMASPSAQRRPVAEKTAGNNDLYATHTALWMIQEAYYQYAYQDPAGSEPQWHSRFAR